MINLSRANVVRGLKDGAALLVGRFASRENPQSTALLR